MDGIGINRRGREREGEVSTSVWVWVGVIGLLDVISISIWQGTHAFQLTPRCSKGV